MMVRAGDASAVIKLPDEHGHQTPAAESCDPAGIYPLSNNRTPATSRGFRWLLDAGGAKTWPMS